MGRFSHMASAIPTHGQRAAILATLVRPWNPIIFATAPRNFEVITAITTIKQGADAAKALKEGADAVKSMNDGKDVKAKAAYTAGQATQKAKEVAGKASETAQNLAEKAKETVEVALDSAKETAQKVKDTAVGAAEDSNKSMK